MVISEIMKIGGLVALSQAVVWKGFKSGTCYIPTLENGIVTTEQFTEVNFLGNLSCHPGFRLIGNDQVECQQGRWSIENRNFPFCAAITSCKEDLPKTPNGIWTPVWGYGQSVHRFDCSLGYLMYGPRTVFCTDSGWSSGSSLPVCTRGGCNTTQLLGAGLEHVSARQVMGGAVYRFYCAKNSVMQGPSTVYCDGAKWSSKRPECLVGPSPPDLTIMVDGATSESLGVIAGQDVVIECDSTDGNPTPDVTIIINGDKVGDTKAATTKHTLTVEEDQSDLNISCQAVNKVASADSDLHSLQLFHSSPLLEISGEREVERGAVAEYACTTGLANPANVVTVHATDLEGNTIDTIIHNEEHQTEEKGVTTKVQFSFQVPGSTRNITLYCKSKHPAGDAETSLNIPVLFSSSHVTISGNTSIVPAEDAQYVCSAGLANPVATLAWTVQDDDGEDIPYTVIATPENDDNISTITLLASDNQDKIHIKCVADNGAGQAMQTRVVHVEKPPTNLTLSCPQSLLAGHTAECLCALPASSSETDVTWSMSDVHGEAVNADRVDYDDGVSLSSKIIFQTVSSHGLVNINCRAANSLGSVEQEFTTVIEYNPSHLILNVPKTVNREELSVDCSTDAANPAKHLTWRINGAEITEGVEASEIVMENGGVISHSVVYIASTADIDQLSVTCCVQGMDLCSSKTATVLETPYLVELEPEEQDAITNINGNIIMSETNGGDATQDRESQAIDEKTSEEYPDTAQIEKPEYNSRYLKETINFENTLLKFVSSASDNILKQWKILFIMSCWSLMYNI